MLRRLLHLSRQAFTHAFVRTIAVSENQVSLRCTGSRTQDYEQLVARLHQLRVEDPYSARKPLSAQWTSPMSLLQRSAAMGSTFVARLAGTYDACRATRPMTSDTAAMVSGSVGGISNSKLP